LRFRPLFRKRGCLCPGGMVYLVVSSPPGHRGDWSYGS
jgi:hypothetical protein